MLSTALGICLLYGCGGGPEMAEVDGKVTFQGKPLDKIQVEFWPTGDGPRSMGVTDEAGHFVLTTDGSRKGAVVGSHKVVLKDVGIHGDKFMGRAGESVDMAKGKKSRVAKVYSEPLSTTLKRDVTSGKCTIDIELSSP